MVIFSFATILNLCGTNFGHHGDQMVTMESPMAPVTNGYQYIFGHHGNYWSPWQPLVTMATTGHHGNY
jgi:hypothetical protein